MLVEYTVDDGVAVITINRPERKNAITLAMRTDIEHAFLKAQDDDAVRVVIFSGAGTDFWPAPMSRNWAAMVCMARSTACVTCIA